MGRRDREAKHEVRGELERGQLEHAPLDGNDHAMRKKQKVRALRVVGLGSPRGTTSRP